MGKEAKKKTRQGREDIIRLILTKNKNEQLGQSVISRENNKYFKEERQTEHEEEKQTENKALLRERTMCVQSKDNI